MRSTKEFVRSLLTADRSGMVRTRPSSGGHIRAASARRCTRPQRYVPRRPRAAPRGGAGPPASHRRHPMWQTLIILAPLTTPTVGFIVSTAWDIARCRRSLCEDARGDRRG